MDINRREALRSVAAALSIPFLAGLSGEELLALGREMHASAASAPQGRHIFRVLDAHQNRTVSLIAEMIIPETDTPGALDANVSEFIDLMLSEQFPVEQRDFFLKGLSDLDQQSRQTCGKDFADCEPEEQVALLEAQQEAAIAAAEAAGPPSYSWGRPHPQIRHFFHMIKSLTLFGYYTSEIGLLDELEWQMMPGTIPDCTSEAANGNK